MWIVLWQIVCAADEQAPPQVQHEEQRSQDGDDEPHPIQPPDGNCGGDEADRSSARADAEDDEGRQQGFERELHGDVDRTVTGTTVTGTSWRQARFYPA